MSCTSTPRRNKTEEYGAQPTSFLFVVLSMPPKRKIGSREFIDDSDDPDDSGVSIKSAKDVEFSYIFIFSLRPRLRKTNCRSKQVELPLKKN